VRWPPAVLATRGIRSIVLRTQTETRFDALGVAVPRRKADYAKLRQAVEDLCDTRRRHLSDFHLAALPRGFDESARVQRFGCLPETPLLLATAVADEIDGSQGATANLCSRLTDPGRFSEERIAAVQATVSQAPTDAGASCKTFQI